MGAVSATVLMSSGSLVIFPLLPQLQERLDVSTAEIGFLAAAGFAAALAAELLLAPFADRGHAKAMGIAGLVLMAAALGMSALAYDAGLLIVGRAVGGIGFGVFMAAASALLVRADPERSGEALGRLGAGELAGVAIGPLASGVGIAFAPPAVILAVSAAVVLLGVVPVALAFSEAYEGGADRAATAAQAPHAPSAPTAPSRTSFGLLRSRRVVGVLLLYGAVMVPVGAYDAIWPRYMADLGAAEWLTALSYALFAVPFVVLSGWAGRFADRRGGVAGFGWGLLVLVPIVLLYGVLTDPWVATGVGIVESSGQALAFIGAAAAMAQTVPAARAGTSQGLLRAFGLLFATAAAAVSGLAYQTGGALALFGGTAAVVTACAVAGLLVVRRARPAGSPLEDGDREHSTVTADAVGSGAANC